MGRLGAVGLLGAVCKLPGLSGLGVLCLLRCIGEEEILVRVGIIGRVRIVYK